MSDKLGGIITTVLSFFIVAMVFGKLFWQPNQYAFSYSGDGYYIQYHMAYHNKYGDGVTLSSMNYPHGELIFLTDAQGAITVLTSWISKHWFDLSPYIIGICNVLLLYSIPIASLLFFLTLRELNVGYGLAIIGALLITFLSPQLIRICTGHLGLGFIFLFPLTIYWLVRQLKGKPSHWGGLFLVLILVFFGFNNPYIMLICVSIIFTTATVVFLSKNRNFVTAFKKSLPVFLVATIPLMIVLFTIKILDSEVDDRVKAPAGYSYNYSMFEGILLPQQPPLYEALQPFIAYPKVPTEGIAYVGLTGFILLLFIIIRWLTQLVKSRGKSWYAWTNSNIINHLLWASIPILIFSMNFFQYDQLKEIKLIPFIQQFRAPGRFAWVFYYVFTLTMVYVIHTMYEYLRDKNWKISAYVIVLFVLSLWTFDDYQFMKYVTRNLPHDNRCSERVQNQYLGQIKNAEVNRETYQAMYILPSMHLWTDKLVYETFFFSEINAFPISLSTGIPFFNAWLSRMSVAQTLSAAQMVSNPLIKRHFEEILSDQRPILLVLGKKAELENGEQQLIAHSDTVLHTSDYTLLKYQPFNNQLDTFWRNAQAVYTNSSISGKAPILQVSFEDQATEKQFYGKGAKSLTSDEHLIWEVNLPKDFDFNRTYECSIWVYVDHDNGGLPFIHVTELDSLNNVIISNAKWACRSKDIQDGWLRVAQEVQFDQKTTVLRFESFYDFNTTVDELQVRTINDTTIIDLPNTTDFLYNNFKIDKPHYD